MKKQPWHVRNGKLLTDERTCIMGVLNVTPDSFSDGGRFATIAAATAHALQMAAEGAHIIDIGGESTRPGSDSISANEELARVIPVVERLAGKMSAVLSIDTTKAMVADAALSAGAHIVNDVSGLTDDAGMAEVIRRHGAGLVIMHRQGKSKNMQDHPVYTDVVKEVGDFLAERIAFASEAGITPEQVVIDPGIGFGKTLEHNLALIRALPRLVERTGRPLLVGMSRKRWIGTITGRAVEDRLAGSLAALSYAVDHGARIIRVHDVKESCDAAHMIDTVRVTEGT